MNDEQLGPANAKSVKPPTRAQCAYCGVQFDSTNLRSKDHVPPRGLYADALRPGGAQLLTVPSCVQCNNSTSDDEAHFRNILALAGEMPNTARRANWESNILRSFDHQDGPKRVGELLAQLEPVEMDGRQRHRVYPGRDARVMRIICKIVRGLCFHHDLLWPVQEAWVQADTLKYRLPTDFESDMEGIGWYHVGKDVLEYRFGLGEEGQSWWLLTFYETCKFVAWVRPKTDDES
jgi:hypothetical protein